MTSTWNSSRRVACRRRSEIFVMLSLAIVSVVRRADAAPSDIASRSSTRHEEALPSGSPSRTIQSEEVGNPSDLAWQAWLLVDANANPRASGILDSASLLRRITPKSIFIAPALTACAEGYQADAMNRCVKDVSIDSQAHRGFLVERLNALFAAKPQYPQASITPVSSSSPTGPLQLNIPLLMSPAAKPIRESPKLQHPNAQLRPLDEATSSDALSHHPGLKPDNASDDAIVTLYELELSSENKSALDRESSKIPSTSSLLPVEVHQHPDDDAPLVVDYKIPVDEDPPLVTDSPNANDSSSEVSPTLVLLLAPKRLTSSMSTPSSNEAAMPGNSSLERILALEDTLVHSSSIPATTTNEPDNVETTSVYHEYPTSTQADSYDQRLSEENVSTEIYDDDEAYSTEFDDEILRHSEAGLTVTPAGINDKSNGAMTTSAQFPNVGKSGDDEATESRITSEVTVNDDFVRETTLVDVRPRETINLSLRATTRSPPSESRESTVLPVGSELEFPVTSVTLNDPKNEKSDDEAPVQGVGALDREMIAADRRFGNEEDRNEEAKAQPREDSRVDNAAVEIDSGARPINDETLRSSVNETSINASRTENPEERRAETSGQIPSTERSESAETMMAASTNVAGTIAEESAFPPTSDKGGKHAVRFVEQTPKQRPSRPEEIYDYEIPYRDSATFERHDSHEIRQDDISTMIRNMEKELYRPDVNYGLASSGQNAGDFYPLAARRDENYVRFPYYEARRDEPPSNRVRFPSDEANSISNEYKERNRRPYASRRNQDRIYGGGDNDGANRLPNANRKESYRWTSNEWRNDRLFTPRSSLADQRSRDRAPMLLKFWTRMPLVRDPSMPYSASPGAVEQRHRRVEPSNDAKSALPSRNGQAGRADRYGDTTSSRRYDDTFSSKEAIIG